tara:strand:+ start:385 stop:582 length:198 start_codon:yes stop_codon:yes gene_type:complete
MSIIIHIYCETCNQTTSKFKIFYFNEKHYVKCTNCNSIYKLLKEDVDPIPDTDKELLTMYALENE